MNVHISYKAGKTPDVEREFQNYLQKLERRLHVFKPDLVHFHAVVDSEDGQGASTSLNLRLPSGQMAAQRSGENLLVALKGAFAELTSQLTKHKELLRGEWSWKARRVSGRKEMPEPAVPFEQTFAAVQLQGSAGAATASNGGDKTNGDLSNWINANLPRLERFVDRELRFRLASGQLRRDQISRAEVIDEVMVSVLSHEEEQPDDISLESWLYRLALGAIRRLGQTNADIGNFSLDAPAGQPDVTGSDENVLQYHQPDDTLNEEHMIRDESTRTPEEIFASEEMVAQLDFVLHQVRPEDREIFVLYTLEGFTVDEIARIVDLPHNDIRNSIQRAREVVQKKLPAQNEFRRSLLRYSRVA